MNSTLSPDQLEKLKEEVRESDTRKEQSLQQFKEWLSKHPFISNFNNDEMILLAFIRARKYAMDRVFESFDKSTICLKARPEWFNLTGDTLERTLQLYDSGFLKIMKERDREGRRVLVCNHNLDPERFSAEDAFRLHCLITNVLSLEEDTQFSGVVYVSDFRVNNSMKYFAMYPLKMLSDFAVQMRFIPMRMKRIFVLGLPSYAAQFMNVVKMGMSEKMAKRLQLVDDTSQLWEIVDKSVMAKDVEGECDEQEIVKDFRRVIDANLERVRSFLTYDVDLEKAGYCDTRDLESIGTFRKLEID